MKKAFGILLILSASILVWRCASQTTPTGGPKDEDPPVLKKSVPTNKQTNFKGKSLELIFDELVKVNNAKEEIIITPSPGAEILFRAKQNKVYIEPKNGWMDSTTYSLAFREGIQDLNEGNSAEDLHLAFSTGATIDSLQISGTLTESLTEKIPEKIIVALYQSDTFDIFKHSPIFFTKTKKDSSFRIENLKQGIYYVYAFEDKNKNLKVESRTEKFGFLPNPILVDKNIDTLQIAIYQIDSRPLKINSIRNTGSITKIKFNKDLTKYSIDNPNRAKIFHSFGADQTEINIYNELDVNDSIKLSLQGTDSLALKIDSTFFIKRVESKQPKEKFSSKIISTSIDPETLAVQVKIQFTKPILYINLDSVYLTADEVPERKAKEVVKDKKRNDLRTDIPEKRKIIAKPDTAIVVKPEPKKIAVQAKDTRIDSVQKILTISTVVDKQNITEKTKQINIVLEKAFLISIENDSTTREIKAISIPNEESTGILHIEVNTKFKNYEVRLLSTSGAIIEKVRNVKRHSFKYLQAQEYKLMFYADVNNNGKWDAQNISEKKAQEPTYFYKTLEGKYTFPIRSAWELGPLILKF